MPSRFRLVIVDSRDKHQTRRLLAARVTISESGQTAKGLGIFTVRGYNAKGENLFTIPNVVEFYQDS